MRLRRNWFAGNKYEAYQRNAVLFGVPVAVAFLPVFFLTCYDNKPVVLGVAGIMATSLCITAALNDPKTRLDAGMARILFVVGAAIILLLVALSVSGMLAMYFVEHSPCSGNFFWSWEFAWSDLGYPAEEFSQRRRNGLLAYALMGSCYMTVALGGSLLGGILGWTGTGAKKGPGPESPEDDALSSQAGTLSDWLDNGQDTPQDPPEFVVALNGEETQISRSQYQYLLAEKDLLLPDNDLLVDKVSGNVFARAFSRPWKKVAFRGRQGPFLLLCVYARHPGRQFTVRELETLLGMELPDRADLNVNDLFNQLQRKPLVPVERDRDGSCIPKSVSVCFLDHLPESSDNSSSASHTPMTDLSSDLSSVEE